MKYLGFISLLLFFSCCNGDSDICHKGSCHPKLLQLCDETELDSKLKELCALVDVAKADNATEDIKGTTKPSTSAVWGYSLLSVTLISLSSVLGVSLLPLMTKTFYSNLITSLIGLAVGSLSGSALFHLIPSAFNLSSVYSIDYLNICLVIWCGVYGFFLIERFLKLFMDQKNNRNKGFQGVAQDNKAPVGHSHFTIDSEEDLETSKLQQVSNGNSCVNSIPKVEVYEQSKAAMRASFGHMERPDTSEARHTVESVKELEKSSHGSKIATVAWMIIFGDGVHNFIDGLSIGAAYSQSILTGISVSAAVLCEEIPHELGDFAVLLNAGMNIKQAMVYNFLSACTCYIGLVLGILLGELEFGSRYIFGAAGGMFLYIALVDMVPELNASMDHLSKESTKSALLVFLLQNIGIGVGIGCLFALARFQEDIMFDL